MMIQLGVYLTALIVLIIPAECSEKKGKSSGPPNVVFILLDAARSDHFSSYGYKKETTPCIDEISSHGALFLNNFSPDTKTLKSMPLIFTSRYCSAPIFQNDTWNWGIRREDPNTIFQGFDSQQILLPALLGHCGYQTAIFHNHWWFVEQTDFIQAHDKSRIFPAPRSHPVDERIIDSVISWMKNNDDRPFYLYCHIMSPHQPYPPKKEDKEFLDGGNLQGLEKARKKFYSRDGAHTGDWSREELGYLTNLYDSNLRHTDAAIGRLYAGIKKLDLADRTLFIITSDHGENLGEHGLLNHDGPPWDSCSHVPLIMVYPPLIPEGVKITGLTESIDIMPTILDLCKVSLPSGKSMDGVKLTNLFQNPDQGKKDVIIGESIRTPEYKYMIRRNLLFDLVKDPGETINKAESKQSVVKQLRIRYDKFMSSYKQRYKEARRTCSPDFSFFYPLRVFSFFPPEIIYEVGMNKPPKKILKQVSVNKSWLINFAMHGGGLICLPGNGPPPPLTYFAAIPDGEYRISTLIKPLGDASLEQMETAFRARFKPGTPFHAPIRLTSTGKKYKGVYYNWGIVAVEDEEFTMEISYDCPDPIPFFIIHVRFDPVLIHNRDDQNIPKEEELRERKKQLKSLGYL